MNLKTAEKVLYRNRKHLSGFGVRTLAVFGSFAREENKKSSDIDILVDFDSTRGFFVFIDLKNYLEDLLQCEVDLVTKNALHPALKKRILREAKNVF